MKAVKRLICIGMIFALSVCNCNLVRAEDIYEASWALSAEFKTTGSYKVYLPAKISVYSLEGYPNVSSDTRAVRARVNVGVTGGLIGSECVMLSAPSTITLTGQKSGRQTNFYMVPSEIPGDSYNEDIYGRVIDSHSYKSRCDAVAYGYEYPHGSSNTIGEKHVYMLKMKNTSSLENGYYFEYLYGYNSVSNTANRAEIDEVLDRNDTYTGTITIRVEKIPISTFDRSWYG